jgi:hypothetical protein
MPAFFSSFLFWQPNQHGGVAPTELIAGMGASRLGSVHQLRPKFGPGPPQILGLNFADFSVNSMETGAGQICESRFFMSHKIPWSDIKNLRPDNVYKTREEMQI